MNSPLDTTAIASILDDVLNETSKMNHLQLDLPDSPPVSPPVEESAAAAAVLFNGTAENHVVLESQPSLQASTSSNANATTNFDLHLTANTVNAIHVDHDYLLRGPPPPNAVHHKSRIRTDDDIILEYCQHNGHEFNLDIASNVELIAEPNNSSKSPTKQLNSASPTKITKYQMVPKPNKRAQQRQQQFLRHSPQFIINPTSPINSLLPLGLSSPRPKPPKMDLPEIKMRLHDKQKFNKQIRKSESSDSSKGGRPKKGTQMHSELTSGSSSTAGQLDVAQPIKIARIATPRPNMRSAKGPTNGQITVRVVPNSSISPSIATAMASTLVSATVMNGIKEKVAEGKLSPLGRSPRTKPDTTPVNYLNKTKKSAATASPKIKKPIGRPRKMPETEPRVKRKYTKRSEKWNTVATQKRPRGRPRKDQSDQTNMTPTPPPQREPTPEPEVAEEEDEEEDQHESEEEDQDQGNEVPDSVKDNKVAVVNAGTSSGAAASTSSSSNRRANPFELVGCQQFEDEDELPFHVKIKADTLAVMDLHAHCLKTEVIGLLGGHYCPITKTVNIRTAEPCPSICNDSIKCEMDPVAQAIALDKLESQNFQVVGWYHSHPTFSPEPSHRDIETQIDYQRMFSEMSPVDGGRPYVAFIISPFIKPDEATVRARMKSATSFTSTLPEQMYAGKRFYSAEKKYAYANFTEVQCRYFTPELNGVLASPYKCFWVANAGAAAGASGSSTAAAAGSTNGTGTEIPYEIQADFTRDSRLIPAIIDKLGPMAMWINRDFPHSVVKLFKTFVRVGSVTVNYLEKIIASLAHHLEASGCAETECERIKQECIAILVEELGTPSDR